MAVLTENIPLISIDRLNLDDYTVMEIFMRKELLKPSTLRFTMRKKQLLRNAGDITFSLADKLLGANVQLQIKTTRRDETMDNCSETLTFSGIIFGAQTQRDRIGQAAIIQVTAYSPDYLLVDNPHCASFENMTLADIIAEAVQPYRDTLTVTTNPQQTASLPYSVQYNETTYQFLSRLAQRHGEYLFYDNGQLYFGQTPPGKNIELYPDVDILGYSYELNMEHTNFHHAQHEYLKYENSEEDGYFNAQGSLHSLTDSVFSHSHSIYRKETLQNLHSSVQEDAPFSHIESSTTVEGEGAKARMATCRMRTNRADICIGDRLTMLEYVDEDGLNQKKHEELLVIGVDYHATLDGHFENEVSAIPSGSTYAPYGLVDLYPVCESQRARVVDNNDPEQLGRIRVQFLWQELQGDRISPWIRITQPHGGDDKGFYFIPEIGEEVMVAFENGNGEKPYVVGTLYHGQQHPGNQWPDNSNNVKAIRTRNGHTIEIHDEGQGGFIRIYDYQKENYILTYSTDEKLIKLESTGNIELYAANDIIMHAGHDITATADHDISESAANDFFMSAGNNMQRTADNDIREYAGHDRSTNIDVNDSLNVGENQFIQIGDNKDEQIAHKLQITAENIREEALDQLLEYSKTHHQKAEKEMAMNAGSRIDIKAGMVKVN